MLPTTEEWQLACDAVLATRKKIRNIPWKSEQLAGVSSFFKRMKHIKALTDAVPARGSVIRSGMVHSRNIRPRLLCRPNQHEPPDTRQTHGPVMRLHEGIVLVVKWRRSTPQPWRVLTPTKSSWLSQESSSVHHRAHTRRKYKFSQRVGSILS
ncbi:hypothetical protein BS50DRAFT_380609 [Corynespora cassiicola Philippines]|uniref:Uncharacterized protein n=1 Tax=Corynespora cassiicola Philippines TaxID=1448308 RepID=A0A2T2NNM6_CORCC|nr:hypothetical protein BS50DRAFT_380609 [Corynespora cassiicola Philippines]